MTNLTVLLLNLINDCACFMQCGASATSSLLLWYLSNLACSLKPTVVLVVWPTAIASFFAVQLITSSCGIRIICQCHQIAIKSVFESYFTTTICALAGKISDSTCWSLSDAFRTLSLDLLHLTGHVSKSLCPLPGLEKKEMEMTEVVTGVRKGEEKLCVTQQRLLRYVFPHFPAGNSLFL